MKSLVTGGSGFIGSNLAKVLVDRGDEVTILDDFSVGKMSHLDPFIENVEVVTGSVCDFDLVRKLVAKVDVVFHLAVQCLMVCNSNPVLAQEVNVGGTFNVCLAAQRVDVKVVYVSSSEVYGTCQFSPMDEQHPTRPQSIYGLSKLIGEEYVKLFNKYYSVPAVIIRPFNTYGPNHRNDQYSCVVTAFIQRLEKGEWPIIEGNGEQSRDFTYVTDMAEGIALLSKLGAGEVVNLGCGKTTAIKEVATTLMKIYNMEPKFEYAEPRPNDVLKLEADTKLARTLGFEPKTSLEDGLRKYVEWWKENV